jgi:hypothetical protein
MSFSSGTGIGMVHRIPGIATAQYVETAVEYLPRPRRCCGHCCRQNRQKCERFIPALTTRSGLQIFFRRDILKIPTGKSNPASSSFFKTGLGKPEQLIRNDAHQWETVRHETKRMRGNSLLNPGFDIHYNPREGGHDTAGESIPYAMIVTVHAPKIEDLFEQIFKRYQFQLSELKPKIQIPIKIG